jgi:hypothetical protein
MINYENITNLENSTENSSSHSKKFKETIIDPLLNRIIQILNTCGIDYEIFKKSSNPQKTNSPIDIIIQFDIDQ